MSKLYLIAILCGLGTFGFTMTQSLQAQTSWEFSPYQIEVWQTAGDSPGITPQLLREIEVSVRDRAKVVASAAWDVHFAEAPSEVSGDLFLADLPPNYQRLKALRPEIANRDKLIAVRIDEDDRGFVATVRYYDFRSRNWESLWERTTPQREQLPFVVWDLIRQSFAPLVRVERVQGDHIDARIRAGGLIVNPTENPAAVQAGDALQPILRRNDRAGEPAAVGGISIVPWSVIHVEDRADGLIAGTMYSGVRFPLPSRGGVRTERLAMKIIPQFPATQLFVESKAAEKQPLEGYDIYSKSPGNEETRLLGRTDWRGSFSVPVKDAELQILFVRSGNKLLARLPLVAGSRATADVRLLDDQQRLQADGLIAAIHSRVTDLVARREILAARIRNLIKQGKFDEAQILVTEYRQLETRNDLLKVLDEQLPTVRSGDKSTQAKVDKLFSDARKLLSKFLDPATADALQSEVQRARQNPQPVPVEPTTAPEPMPASTSG